MMRIDVKAYRSKQESGRHAVSNDPGGARRNHRVRNAATRSYAPLFPLALIALMACTSPLGVETGDRERIQAQRAIWEAQQISDYTFETRQVCFCAFVGWLAVTVEADTVQSIVALEDTEVPAWITENYPTIDGLFDILVDAVERDAAQIDVTWHETMGYPTTFFIDYLRNAADEELGHDVRLLTTTP